MIATFGCGIGDDFDISKLVMIKLLSLRMPMWTVPISAPYYLHSFIVLCLSLSLQEKYIGDLPPLYRVEYETIKRNKKTKEFQYLYNDFELDKFRKNNDFKILNIQRYKGLGEMDAHQLWETTLNPETRILAKITISDNIEADEITSTLMSSNVPPRRTFIMEEARYAKLDI